MKIVRHLLSFTWLFVILAFLIGLVYFRADLFPEYINKPVDKAVAVVSDITGVKIPQYKPKIKPAETQLIETEQEASEVVVVEESETETAETGQQVEETESFAEQPSTDKTEDMEAVVEIVEEAISEKIEEMIQTADGGNQAELEEAPAEEEATEQEPVIAAEIIEAPEIDAEAEVESDAKMEEAVVDSEIIKPEPTAQAEVKAEAIDTRQMLRDARRLYWEGKLSEAEEAYAGLAEADAANPDVFGELGNIYYAQGKWKQAGESYYRAALLLIDLNQPAQVNY